MRGITDKEAAALIRNLPNTPPVTITDPDKIAINAGLRQRSLLKYVVNPDTGNMTLNNTTELGKIALYCYYACRNWGDELLK